MSQISLTDVSVHFETSASFFRRRRGGTVKALNELSLHIRSGECLGIVGESGCGKSTLGRVIAGLQSPTVGACAFMDRSVYPIQAERRLELSRFVQMVFQDPYGSVNPRMTVGEVIAEPLKIHGLAGDEQAMDEKVSALLDAVQLSPEMKFLFPHACSGGQLQRVGIARALALEPKVLVCDEVVSALDVSVQAEIVKLLGHLRQDKGLTLLFVSHDLGIVRELCERLVVMYLGRVVEDGLTERVIRSPRHPYTQLLLDSVPSIDGHPAKTAKKGEVSELPSPIDLPAGCGFHPRCDHVTDGCRTKVPVLEGESGGRTACFHPLA